ncbi:MAG: arginine--tRNA ligase [Chloroflexi bacterium]|nr:arginine--tRNA ligase [Chloroflexota bacterium]
MIKNKLTNLLKEAINRAWDKSLLPVVPLPDIIIEHPQQEIHGDYSSNLPLKLSRVMRKSPMDIARVIVDLIPQTDEIEKVNTAAPGFINFTIRGSWLAGQVETIIQSDDKYGNLDEGKNKRVQIEFVSVNPTGPVHVGHGRGAILGSVLSNVLKAAGYYVEREYYVNDAGNQMEAFYRSLYARYLQALGLPYTMPEEGYVGEYVLDLAKEIVAEKGNTFTKLPVDQATREIGMIGLDKVLIMIKNDLEAVRVDFDVWFREQSLFSSGQYDRVMALLGNNGHTIQKEGALWFASTALGEDKDNVLVRSNGSPTYFASDVAYHHNKFVERKFDTVIDIWGADHQGHVSRMKAVLTALGIPEDKLHVIISQLVTLRRGENVVRLSKRSGDLVTLRELVDEVGADACRFFFLTRSTDSQMDFDIELAKQQSADNPVYYIQYAYARISSIMRLAAEKNIDFTDGDVSLLVSGPELTLIRKMVIFPEIIELISRSYEPHHLTFYALELATNFHGFYKECRVISDDDRLTKARLKLVKAAIIVFGRTLALMGMTAPESM